MIGVSQKSRVASEALTLRVKLNDTEIKLKVEDNISVLLLKKRIVSVGLRRAVEA